MRPQALISGDAAATPANTSFLHAGHFASKAIDDPTLPAMSAVTLIHALALFLLLYTFEAPSEQPVLSFTVTLMDLSSSPNTISSAASTASTPAQKPETKPVEEVTPTAKAAKQKAIAKPKPVISPKVNSKLAHNARQQTAVLAPITPAQFDAAYLQNPKPEYPALSRRLGEQGNVMLAVYVNEDGRAANITLKKGSGFSRLDNAALEAVQRWRFAPARQGEQLIASWVNVPVKFVLE